ncbi:hypothetical protein Dsin_019827 [Dipteronia sinensis]|uniref:Uncharacterized protein n=1 Tax=Dipteronia sinensis TaxID=43782 RepID=A0AAE0E3G0_9ROSI|nr:hypothetical protein Dsin_019827 [Dipteronia sinensis]
MSNNRLRNNCKSDPMNSPDRQVSDQINYELVVLGWFKKLEFGVQNDLIRELSSKVQSGSTSIDHNKLDPSESEEDFRLRKFKDLLEKYPTNSKKAFGTKVLKAYVRSHGLSHLSLKRQVCTITSSSVDHDQDHHHECNFLNNKLHDQLFKVKSLDHHHLQRGVIQTDHEESSDSLKLELFKIRTLVIRGGGTQGGSQGSSDEQVQQ